MPPDALADSVRSRLRAAAGKARHPDLVLWRFAADMDVLPDGDEISEDDVPAGQREPAELRRAAPRVAAADVTDRCIDDLQLTEFGDDQRPDAGGTADSFVCQWVPGGAVPPVRDWFSPFNGFRVVHPSAETPPSAPVLHDLYPRLGPEDDPVVVLAPGVVDAAAPVASRAAGSEIVALARQAAAPGDGPWVADAADPERSFAALVTAAVAGEGSGWLEWEPRVGDDEPWVHASVGGGRFLAVPLRFVVSYRPDPQVRRGWEQRFSDLLP